MPREEEKRASVSSDELASMLREIISDAAVRSTYEAGGWHTSSCECPICRARMMLRRYRGDVMSPVGVRWSEPE